MAFWLTGTLALALAYDFQLSAGTRAQAGGMVVMASGPSARAYPQGRAFARGERLALQRGDRIGLIDGGRYRELIGPGTLVVGQARPSAEEATAIRLVLATGKGPARLGGIKASAIEGMKGPRTSKTKGFSFDRAKPAPGATPADEDLVVALAGKDYAAAETDWRKPPADPAAPFCIERGATPATPTANLRAIDPVPADLGPDTAAITLADQLLAQGCTAQLDALTTALAAD